jgi:hypothetical protein
MTPLEAARQIADWEADKHGSADCEPQCAWRQLPQIVVTLEAAERLAGVWQEMSSRRARRRQAPWAEVAPLPSAADLTTEEHEVRAAFVAALTGVGVPA